jgi:hypothetical protein
VKRLPGTSSFAFWSAGYDGARTARWVTWWMIIARCRLLLNHAVASLMEGQIVKVICRRFSEHAFSR